MSISMYSMNSYFDNFLENCGDYSEEQGERFYQNICVREERSQGRLNVKILADYSDYCWCFKRNVPASQRKTEMFLPLSAK